jgi:hypothetical protein
LPVFRIFWGHSSANAAEAIAIQEWRAEQGRDDNFLYLDPDRGINAGQRWQDALKRAAERCEVVIFLISRASAASKWCLAEFLLAKQLNTIRPPRVSRYQCNSRLGELEWPRYSRSNIAPSCLTPTPM